MLREIKIIGASLLLVLLACFFIYNFSGNFTGNVIVDNNFNNLSNNVSQASISKLDVEFALNNSEAIIAELDKVGFGTTFMRDTLIEAKKVYQQAVYAEILRDSSIAETSSKKIEAKKALNLITWKNIDYSSVLVLTDKIEERKKQAYDIFDSLNALDKRIKEYSDLDIDATIARKLYNEAQNSFSKEQYNDSINFIDRARQELEKSRTQTSTLNSLKNNAKNFFYRYWYYILIFIVVLGFVLYFAYNKIRINLLTKNIEKLRAEQKVLVELMKRTQEERFKQNKISGLVYNIRVKKYDERQNEIKDILPVLESRLKIISGKR